MKLQIIAILLIIIGVATGLAQLGEEFVTITITSEGKAKISQILFPKTFVSTIDVHIISEKISNLLAIDEKSILLGATQNQDLLKIATLGASAVDLKYNANILTYESGVFRLKYSSELESKVSLPPLSKLVSLNTIPIEITDEYILPPGDISLSYTIRPVTSKEFFVTVEDSEQKIEVITAAKVEEFSVNKDEIQFIIKDKAIALTIIPKKVMTNPNDALLNGEEVDFSQFHQNATHSWIRIDPHEKGLVRILDTGEELGGCLIATATYDSELAPQVQLLREIRDNQLMKTVPGVSFMSGFNQFYYSFSPYVADMQRENPMFKEFIKIAITPMLSSLSVMTIAESESEIIGYGIGVILLNIGMYFVLPFVIFYNFKKIMRTLRMPQSNLMTISRYNVISAVKKSLFGIVALLVLTVSVSSAFDSAFAQSDESESPIKMVLDLTRENIEESLDSVAGGSSAAQTFYDLGQDEYQQALDALDNGDKEAAAEHAIIAMALYEDSAEVIGEIQESFDDIGDGIPSGFTEQFASTNIFAVQEQITEFGSEFEEFEELAGSNDVEINFEELGYESFDEAINSVKEDFANGDTEIAQAKLGELEELKEDTIEQMNEKAEEEQEQRIEEFGEALAEKIEDALEQEGLDEDVIEQMETTLEILQTGEIEDILESTSEDSEFVKEVVENEIEEELGEPESGTDDSTESGTDDSTESGTDDSTESGTDDSTESGTDDSTESGTDDGVESGTDDSTESGTDDSTESGTDDSTESGTDDNTESGTDDSTESGTDDNTESGTDDNTESGTDDGVDDGTSGAESSGADSFEDSGADSFEDSGADSFEDSGADSFEDSGADSFEDSGADSFEDSGADSFEDSGADSFEDGIIESFEDSGVDDTIEDSFEESIEEEFEEAVEDTPEEETETEEEVVEEEDNTTICHNGDQTLNLPDGAIVAHLGHGDVLGACVINGVTIGANFIEGNNFSAEDGVVIGNDVTVGNNVDIKRDAIIGDNVNLGNNVTIEYEVIIGDNAVIGNNADIKHDAIIGDNFSSTGNDLTIEELNVIGNRVTITGNDVTIKKEAGLIGDDVTIDLGNGADVSEEMLVVCHIATPITTSIVISALPTHVPGHTGDTLGVCIINPIADAGPDQPITEFSVVTLDGTGSLDTDGTIVSYAWTQTIGTSVTLDLTVPEQPTFTAPGVGAGGEILTFSLEVTDDDGAISTADTVDITIDDVGGNNPPTADAGPPQTVDEFTLFVTLDGTGSSDTDGTIVSYAWTQTIGTSVTLDLTVPEQPTFTAPSVGTGSEILTFSLEVTDNGGATSTADTVDITIDDCNGYTTGNNPQIHGTATIGDCTVAGNSFTAEEDTVVGVSGSIGNSVTIKKDAEVGDYVTLTNNVTIEERTVIGDNFIVGNSFSKVEVDTLIGNGVTVNNGVTDIGKDVIIGNNAIITQNVPEGTVIADDETY